MSRRTWEVERMKFPPAVLEQEEETRVRLRRLFPEEALVIGRTDGSETIAHARGVFKFIDDGFKKMCETGPETSPTPVGMQKALMAGTSAEIFGSVGPLDKLLLFQHQIVQFCRDYDYKLDREAFTSFLLQWRREILCVSVKVELGIDLSVHFSPVGETLLRPAGTCIVVPGMPVHFH